MSKEQKFYVCKHCGNLVGLLNDAGVPLICCGEPMTELVANTTDAASEKHVPVVTAKGHEVTVNVGSVSHPMTGEHHIAWIYLQTTQGGHRKCPEENGAPQVTFALTQGEKPLAAFAYCNLHGLWKTDCK